MTVTGLEELTKSRSKVYLDNEFAFVLYKGELRIYGVKMGEELNRQSYEQIMAEVLPKRAKLRAMNLLKQRDYTTEQLRRKLKEGLYPEKIIDIALDYVASYHYTDDIRYAVSYMTYHESTKSRKRIEQDLMNKGISKSTLETAWQEWEERGGSQDEDAMIEKLLEKRHYNASLADEKERQKTFGFLMRKGFSAEHVRRAVYRDNT